MENIYIFIISNIVNPIFNVMIKFLIALV